MSEAPSVIEDTVPKSDPRAVLIGHLKIDNSDLDAEFREIRSRVLLIGAVLMALLSVVSLVGFASWKRHGPQFVSLKDGWYRITDQEYGIQFELPGWYQKNANWGDGGQRYSTNYQTGMQVVVRTWKKPASGITNPTAELKAILSAAASAGPIEVLSDQSADLANPTIEFIISQYTRRKIIIRGDTLVDMSIYTTQVTNADFDRAVKSLRWMR